MADYRDDLFEWDEAKSADRFVERCDEAHSGDEDRYIATGLLGPVLISIVYTERDGRRRIISAFEADDDDIADFMVTYAVE